MRRFRSNHRPEVLFFKSRVPGGLGRVNSPVVTVLHCTNSPASDEEVLSSSASLTTCGRLSPLHYSGQGAAPGSDFVTHESYCRLEFSAILGLVRPRLGAGRLTSPEHRSARTHFPEFPTIRAIRRRESAWPYLGKNSFPFVAVPFALASSPFLVAYARPALLLADAAKRNGRRKAPRFQPRF